MWWGWRSGVRGVRRTPCLALSAIVDARRSVAAMSVDDAAVIDARAARVIAALRAASFSSFVCAAGAVTEPRLPPPTGGVPAWGGVEAEAVDGWRSGVAAADGLRSGVAEVDGLRSALAASAKAA